MCEMNKTAFVFAGQGAQRIGMGKEMLENSLTRPAYEEARDVLSDVFFDLVWEGEQEKLNQTAIAQPALFWHGYALANYLLAKGIKAEASCGLSLGEYTALAVAGALPYKDGLELVKARGSLMGADVGELNSGMLALMTDDFASVEESLAEMNAVANHDMHLYISNLNCPGQIVVAGDKEQLALLQKNLSTKGVKRAIPLAVEGAFHTPFLAEAASQFSQLLAETDFQESKWPVYSNYDAQSHQGNEWRAVLEQQMLSTVRLEACLRALIEQGIGDFIEIGPGKVISGCLKKIDPTVRSYQVSDLESADAAVAALT